MKSYRRRTEPLNWKLLASIDLVKFSIDLNNQQNISDKFIEISENIAFCSFESEFVS